MSQEKLVRIGKIVGCHGLRGDVQVRPASENPTWVGVLKEVTLGRKTLRIQRAVLKDRLVYLSFEEHSTRNDVEPLVGSKLFAPFDALPDPGEGEFWVDDMLGLTVLEEASSKVIGTVKDVLSSGGMDYLEIQLMEQSDTQLIPFTHHFFPTVDMEKRQITTANLEGFWE